MNKTEGTQNIILDWIYEVFSTFFKNVIQFALIMFLLFILPFITKSNAGIQDITRAFCKCENLGNTYEDFKTNCSDYLSEDGYAHIDRINKYQNIFYDESESQLSKILIMLDSLFCSRKLQHEIESYCPSKESEMFEDFGRKTPYLKLLSPILLLIFIISALFASFDIYRDYRDGIYDK